MEIKCGCVETLCVREREENKSDRLQVHPSMSSSASHWSNGRSAQKGASDSLHCPKLMAAEINKKINTMKKKN